MAVVNLNQARKAQAKATAKSQAAANRVKFGLTKTQKAASKVAKAKSNRALDGAKREP
jgi:hypothetical protein